MNFLSSGRPIPVTSASTTAQVEPIYSEDTNEEPEYKKFSAAVEKSLQVFDNVTEWADIITFLTRIAKLLQSNSHYGVIPKKMTLAKRLAQCLNPALPTGVHQKALEAYGLVFHSSKKSQLAEDLTLWTTGLFPFANYAAMSVRGSLLALYEKYLIPLGPGLRPVLKTFVLGILPLLEEEGNEFFGQSARVLQSLCNEVEPIHFYQALWLAIITTPKSRLASVNYLIKYMPVIATPEDVAVTLGKERRLFARALCCLLEDKAPLVRRGGLELLANHVFLHGFIFGRKDTEDLVGSAITVLLSRDMSLNRRLYSWLLKSSDHLKSTIELISQTLSSMIYADTRDVNELTKPFRILMALLDKPDIGQETFSSVFLNLLHGLKHLFDQQPQLAEEVLHSASRLFEMVDQFIIWDKFLSLLDQPSEISLIEFVLEKFALSDDESQRIHLPFFYRCIVSKAAESIDKMTTNQLDAAQDTHAQERIHHLLNLALQAAHKISSPVFSNTWSLKDFRGLSNETRRRSSATMRTPSLSAFPSPDTHTPQFSGRVSSAVDLLPPSFADCGGSTVDDIAKLYDAMNDPSKEEERKKMIRSYLVGKPSLQEGALELQHLMIKILELNWKRPNRVRFWLVVWTCLCDLITVHSKNGFVLSEEHKSWISAIMKWCSRANTPIFVIKVTFNCLEPYFLSKQMLSHLHLDSMEIDSFAKAIAIRSWSRLDNDHISSHVDAVDMLSKLEFISRPAFIENTILQHILSSTEGKNVELQRLGVFWRLKEENDPKTSILYSRLLFLIFDDLCHYDWEIRIAAEIWIRSHVKHYTRLLQPLLAILCHSRISYVTHETKAFETTLRKPVMVKSFNMSQTEYAFRVLSNLLALGADLFKGAIWEDKIEEPWVHSHCSWISSLVEGESLPLESLKYAEGLALIVLRMAIAEQDSLYADLNAQKLAAVQSSAFRFLTLFIQDSRCMRSPIIKIMFEALLHALAFSIETQHESVHNDMIIFFQKICSLTYEQDPIFPDQDKRVTGILIPVLLRGLSDKLNRKNFQIWLDLNLFHVSKLSNRFDDFAQPLLNMITREINQYSTSLQELHTETFLQSPGSKDCLAVPVPEDSSDVDMLALLVGAEHILKTYIAPSLSGSITQSPVNSSTSSTVGGVPLLSQVFGSSGSYSELNSKGTESSINANGDVFISLPDLIFEIVMLLKYLSNHGAEPNPFRHLLGRFKHRGKRLFDMLYTSAPRATIECFILVWQQESSRSNLSGENISTESATMDALELLSGWSPRSILNHLIEILRAKIPSQLTTPPSGTVPDSELLSINVTSVLQFMDIFLDRCSITNDEIVGIWQTMYPCLREACGHAANIKFLFPAFLRLQVTFSFKCIRLHDKRVKREMDDMFQRICDYCILLGGRAFEQGPWRKNESYDLPRSGSVKPSESTSVRNLNSGIGDMSLRRDRKAKPSDDAIVRDMMLFMAETVIPAFKMQKLLTDTDRILAIVSNIMTYIVSPSLKTRSSTNKMLAVPLLELLASLGTLTQAAKIWKKDVWEAFMDAKFFHIGSKSLTLWKKIVLATIHLDKERIDDILVRCMPLGSSSLFTSKEQEIMMRSQMIKKLSFVVFTAPKDHFHPQLPSIQEKIVEIFKTPHDLLLVESYFLIRVLILRMASKHLSNFWPILMSELFRLFGSILKEEKEFVKNVEKPIFAAACRLLDYLVVLGFPEYQYYQSMFLSEPEVAASRSGWKKSKSVTERLDRLCDDFNVITPNRLDFAGLKSPGRHYIYQRKPFIPKVNTPQLLKDFLTHLNELVQSSGWSPSEPAIDSLENLLETEFLDGGSTAAMFAPPQLTGADIALNAPSKPKLIRQPRSRKSSSSSTASGSSPNTPKSGTPPRSRPSSSASRK